MVVASEQKGGLATTGSLPCDAVPWSSHPFRAREWPRASSGAREGAPRFTLVAADHEIHDVFKQRSAEEAVLFAAGEGHRCHQGDCLHVEMDQLYDDAA